MQFLGKLLCIHAFFAEISHHFEQLVFQRLVRDGRTAHAFGLRFARRFSCQLGQFIFQRNDNSASIRYFQFQFVDGLLIEFLHFLLQIFDLFFES